LKKAFQQIFAAKQKYGTKSLLKMFPDKIWGVMQDSVYKKKIREADELQERVVEEWERLNQSVIDSVTT